MGFRVGFWLAVGAVLVAPTALAGTIGFAQLEFQFANWPTVVFDGTGATGVSVSDIQFGIDAGSAFKGVHGTIQTFPGVAFPSIPASRSVRPNGGGVFTGATPDAVTGTVPFPAGWGIFTLPFVQFDFGQTGTVNTPFGALTAQVGRWRVGSAVVTNVTTATPSGTVTGASVTRAGSNGLTPGGVGAVTVVSPVRFSFPAEVAILGGHAYAGFGALTLTFVPEPGPAVLLVCAAVGVAWMGRRHHFRG